MRLTSPLTQGAGTVPMPGHVSVMDPHHPASSPRHPRKQVLVPPLHRVGSSPQEGTSCPQSLRACKFKSRSLVLLCCLAPLLGPHRAVCGPVLLEGWDCHLDDLGVLSLSLCLFFSISFLVSSSHVFCLVPPRTAVQLRFSPEQQK